MRRRRFRKLFLKSGVFTEEVEHIAAVNHLRRAYPEALYTIAPSGNALPFGTALKFMEMGYRTGTADILILEPRGAYHGLLIEMKIQKGGKVSPAQKLFLEQAQDRGYVALVCEGAAAAVKIIDEYMGMKCKN